MLTTFPRKLRGPVKGRSGASFLMGVDDAGQAREMCEEQAVAFHSVLPPLGALPSPLLVTLHEARLFWLALHAVMHCRDSHFKRCA
ncbi:MAG: hypothetical protein P4L40_09745 [Terracidiphilus sp.]|nr:hypothetical protein [Terracidiphilus sp.]